MTTRIRTRVVAAVAARGIACAAFTAACVLSSAPASAQQTPRSDVLGCGEPFTRGSSHARLAAHFGAANVVVATIGAPPFEETGSIVFPNDPRRRLEVTWHDRTRRAKLHMVTVKGRSAWRHPSGVRLGLTLAEVQALNGKPFSLFGFAAQAPGGVGNLRAGALRQGDCWPSIGFAPDPAAPAAARARVNTSELYESTDAEMRAANPRVSDYSIGYAAE